MDSYNVTILSLFFLQIHKLHCDFSSQNAIATVEEEDDSKHSASSNVPNSLTTDSDVPSTAVVPESSESKQLTDLPSGGNQYSMVNNSPTYSFGILPTMVGSQVTPIQSTESQARDASRLPGFIVSPQVSDLLYPRSSIFS